jgi:hypothetical protein
MGSFTKGGQPALGNGLTLASMLSIFARRYHLASLATALSVELADPASIAIRRTGLARVRQLVALRQKKTWI